MGTNGSSILVLCTGNSARSQIAAAYLEKYVGDRFDIYSAGSEPAAEIHPLAIEVMAEQGITVEGEPTDLRVYLEELTPDYVIIVCEGAARACPVWPGPTERLLWPFEDPAAATGSDAQRLESFRRVRDQIDEKIRAWADKLV